MVVFEPTEDPLYSSQRLISLKLQPLILEFRAMAAAT